MNTMDCKNIEELFSAYTEKELDAQTAVLLESHLSTCKACMREWDYLKETLQWIACIEHVPPPSDLLAGIHEKLEQRNIFSRFINWFRYANPTMSIPAAAMTVLLAFAGMSLYKNFFQHQADIPFSKETQTLNLADNKADLKPYLNTPTNSYQVIQKPDFQGFRFDVLHSRLQSKNSTNHPASINYNTRMDRGIINGFETQNNLFEAHSDLEDLLPGNNFRHHLTPDFMITLKTADPATRTRISQQLLAEKKWHPKMYKNDLFLLFLKSTELTNLQNTLALQEIGGPPFSNFPGPSNTDKMLMVAVRIQ